MPPLDPQHSTARTPACPPPHLEGCLADAGGQASDVLVALGHDSTVSNGQLQGAHALLLRDQACRGGGGEAGTMRGFSRQR
jgi:hypothetical protein